MHSAMKTSVEYNGHTFEINLAEPLDIAMPLQSGDENVNAWYLDPPTIAPHQIGDRPGLVREGSAVNFNDIWFNPHAHGTHTECVGHICPEVYSVTRELRHFFYKAALISIQPEEYHGDLVIQRAQLEDALPAEGFDALVLRTLPNTPQKLHRHYSNTNPPYLLEAAARYLAERGIDHLLIDLPSVDKEADGGALLAHKAFWNFGGPLRMQATITELVYIPDDIADGHYFLNLLPAPFVNDASPSRPILYKILET